MTVAPKVAGYVAEVFVADNQAVSAGEPLVRLDSRQYQAILEQAKAAIAARKADIERGEAEMLQQKANIQQVRAHDAGQPCGSGDTKHDRRKPDMHQQVQQAREAPGCIDIFRREQASDTDA